MYFMLVITDVMDSSLGVIGRSVCHVCFCLVGVFLGTAEEREVRKKERDDVKICQGKVN